MTTIGSLQEFCMDSKLTTAYPKHVRASSVEDHKKVAVLLSVIGGKTYNLLKSLLAPAAPGDKSYKEIVKVLKEHFDEPKSSFITERFHFHRRMQVRGNQ